jgi:hypothetical protein
MRRVTWVTAVCVASYALAGAARAQSAPDTGASAGPTVTLASGETPQPSDAAASTADDSADSASEDATALAKKLQNPIGNLYSIPFQGNTNFHYGPNNGTQELLNIQPVIPLHITPDWNIITRTILPLIWQPSLLPAQTVPFGLGPTSFSAFLSPSKPVNGFVWGVGPIVQLPTITSKTLGSNVWGGGPTGVLVYLKGPVVTGVLINNVWSFGGTSGRGGTRYDNFTLQPFFNYNLAHGWYFGTSPLITASWLTTGDHAWNVPVGANAGRVIRIGGKLPVNFQLGLYANPIRPPYSGSWQLKTQMTIIF